MVDIVMTDKNDSEQQQLQLKEIGKRIKARRTYLGYNLDDLGKAMGVSRTQARKYEEGTNKMDCIKVILAASFLNVPTCYFLENQEGVQKTDELSLHFNKLPNGKIKDLVIVFCKLLAEALAEEPEINN